MVDNGWCAFALDLQFEISSISRLTSRPSPSACHHQTLAQNLSPTGRMSPSDNKFFSGVPHHLRTSKAVLARRTSWPFVWLKWNQPHNRRVVPRCSSQVKNLAPTISVWEEVWNHYNPLVIHYVTLTCSCDSRSYTGWWLQTTCSCSLRLLGTP